MRSLSMSVIRVEKMMLLAHWFIFHLEINGRWRNSQNLLIAIELGHVPMWTNFVLVVGLSSVLLLIIVLFLLTLRSEIEVLPKVEFITFVYVNLNGFAEALR